MKIREKIDERYSGLKTYKRESNIVHDVTYHNEQKMLCINDNGFRLSMQIN